MDGFICDRNSVADIQKRLQTIFSVLNQFSLLTDSYVLDFFTESLWTKIPQSWQIALYNINIDDLSSFLDISKPFGSCKPWPLSLLALREIVEVLAVSRKPVDSSESLEEFLNHYKSHKKYPETSESISNSQTFSSSFERLQQDVQEFGKLKLLDGSWWGKAENELTVTAGQHKGLDHIMRRRVKPKKQHEIVRLSQAVSVILSHIKCNHVVDVGSGQGHLSRMLAFSEGLRVTSIEAESSHVSGAQQIDNQVVKNLEKQKKKMHINSDMNVSNSEESFLPSYLIQKISSDISGADFSKVLIEALDKKSCPNNTSVSSPFVLVGLHTCGNLASTLLRVFVECQQAEAILSVACCYMKLDIEKNARSGYPMSSYLKTLPNSKLSYWAREVACHAIEKYHTKFKDNINSLKIHCYRAALEKFIIKSYPELRRMGLCSVKNAHKMEFSRYAEAALRKSSISASDLNLQPEEISILMSQWKNVITFYSLRLLLAPLIESVILLDRMLFLLENGVDSCLIPLFDPLLSPRNHVIVAIK